MKKLLKNEISEQYFVKIVEEEKDLMLRLAYNILQNTTDSEDVVAESVLKAWEKRDSLRNPAKLRNWMIRITVNTAKNMISKRNRVKLVEDFQDYGEKESEGGVGYFDARIFRGICCFEFVSESFKLYEPAGKGSVK